MQAEQSDPDKTVIGPPLTLARKVESSELLQSIQHAQIKRAKDKAMRIFGSTSGLAIKSSKGKGKSAGLGNGMSLSKSK